KRLGESVLVAATPDRVNRAELEVKLSQTRAREAEDMASRGKGALAVRAVEDRVSLLQAAGRDLASAFPRNARWRTGRSQFLNATDASMDDIEHYLDVTGQTSAAAEVRRLDTGWIRQQVPLRESLGQPSPTPSPPPPAR